LGEGDARRGQRKNDQRGCDTDARVLLSLLLETTQGRQCRRANEQASILRASRIADEAS
jgi:hypothetical protein